MIDEHEDNQGRLRIFLGMSAGVGKTYAMLQAAKKKMTEGVHVLIGLVETHGRSETEALLFGMDILPRKVMRYRDVDLQEMDIDEILRRRPELVIVDELAHTNVPGSRHVKRYQDVLEILEAGIDVYTSVNVQHLESRKESVEQITGTSIRETVPDSLLERAQLVELVDIAPVELLRRLQEGKVYLGERAQRAVENFFTEDKLTALREIALRMTAERVGQDLQRFSHSREKSPWPTNERLLVAISHSPHSEKIIRTTRRLAYNLEAPWIALYVDTGLTLHDFDQAQLQRNLDLARDLKAEVMTTTDTDIASAIQRISRFKNVTQVVIGRPTRSSWRNIFEGGSFLNKLIKDVQEVDIHIVGHKRRERVKQSFKDEILLYRTKTGWLKYYNVSVFFTAVTILGALVEALIGYRAVGFLFLLAVILTSLWGSIGAVLFAAILSSLIWNLGFIPPRFTFTISSADDVILVVSYFVVALASGILTNRVRVRENLIKAREEKTNLMNLLLQDISLSKDIGGFVSKAVERIGSYFIADISVVLKSQEGLLEFEKSMGSVKLGEKEQAVAQWCFQNRQAAGWSTDTLSQARALYFPLQGLSEIVGVLVYRPMRKIKRLTVDQKELLNSLIAQIGVSVESYLLNIRVQQAQRIMDSELLHRTLLNSISHEMRTPLTTILGLVTTLEEKVPQESEYRGMIENLEEAGDRLNSVIENLLDMSRLNSGLIGLKFEWHDPLDVIGVVLKKLEKKLKSCQVDVSVSDRIGLIQIDYRLFEHAISNLVLNSVQYAGDKSKIQIQVEPIDNKVVISVCDNGPGIPAEYRENLFEKFYRVPGTPAGGTGLGLSIVKGIVELHKGTIAFKPMEPHGSCFVIELPLKETPKVYGESIV